MSVSWPHDACSAPWSSTLSLQCSISLAELEWKVESSLPQNGPRLRARLLNLFRLRRTRLTHHQRQRTHNPYAGTRGASRGEHELLRRRAHGAPAAPRDARLARARRDLRPAGGGGQGRPPPGRRLGGAVRCVRSAAAAGRCGPPGECKIRRTTFLRRISTGNFEPGAKKGGGNHGRSDKG